MPMSVVGGLFFLLAGLSVAWMGVYMGHPSRSALYSRHGQLLRRWSPIERQLWRIAWTTMGVGFVCLGVTVLRYAKGPYVVVPVSAPLIDHVIWGLVSICMVGGFAMLLVCMAVSQTAEEKRARREHADEL